MIRSGWVLRPRIAMILQSLTLQLYLVHHQLVVGQTHARGGTFDLLMTDVPNLVRIAVAAHIGNSHHSSSAVIPMAPAVPILCVRRKVFLNHQVN